jgi:hypothetical protein
MDNPVRGIDNPGRFLNIPDIEKIAVGSVMMGRSKVYMGRSTVEGIALQPSPLTNHQSFVSTLYPSPLHIC